MEADGKQTGSRNDRKLQGQLCLCTERGELEARRQTLFPFPLPRAGKPDKKDMILGIQPAYCLTWWGWVVGGRLPLGEATSLQGAGRAMEVCKALQTQTPLQQLERAQAKQGAAGPRPLLLQGRGRPGRRDGIRAKIRFTNEAHGRSNFAITHSLLCN